MPAPGVEGKRMFYLKAALPDSNPSTLASARRHLNALELTDSVAFLACANQILAQDLGFLRSADTKEATLGSGEPIPMWSYAAVEYLMALDLRGFNVLELGGGQSTYFLSKRCKSTTVIETDDAWLTRLRSLPNVTVVGAAAGAISNAMAQIDRKFDLICIDPAENRYACAKAALPKLNRGGIIVLDNAEWYPNTTALLRSHDLIQVDFYDFRPSHHYRAVTSLFIHREFRPKPSDKQLPQIPIGGRPVDLNGWDQIK
jgi:hypothetical protein